MAVPGRPLDYATRQFILRASTALSIRKTAAEAGVSRNTVRKILRESIAK